MRGNVKTIKLTTCLSLAFAVITYIISITESLGISECEWLPYTFLLAVFGGSFASMLVVLICEVSNYIQNRKNAEAFIFSHLCYLYGQLQVIQKNIDFFLAQNGEIYKNALTQLIANAEAEIYTLYYAEYTPYRKKNAILTEKQNYNKNVFPVILKFLQNCRNLEIAVLTDKINSAQKDLGIDGGMENCARLVLSKLSYQIQEPISMLDILLTRVDKLCNNRYNWSQQRDDLLKRIPDNQTNMLEQFLQEK